MINPILKRAADTYGKEKRYIQFTEEAGELMKEISKNFRGKHNEDQIAEELADVYIMLDQLTYLFDVEHDVSLMREYKIDRLEARLNDEK